MFTGFRSREFIRVETSDTSSEYTAEIIDFEHRRVERMQRQARAKAVAVGHPSVHEPEPAS